MRGEDRMASTDNLFTDGDAYERMMGRWSRLAGATFLHWLDPPKNLRWLDAGCGNGAFTEELISRCSPASPPRSTRPRISSPMRGPDPA